jgi:hypothetical protein
MIVKKNKSKFFAKSFLSSRYIKYTFLIIIGFMINRYGLIGNFKYSSKKTYNSLKHFLYGKNNFDKKIYIDIKHENFQKLAFNVQQANEISVLQDSHKEYVSANIQYQNKNFKAKVKLKGEENDHRKDGFWSLRIKITDDSFPFGIKEFSIQKPYTRNFLYEWFVSEIMKGEDILTTRYDFMEVVINGKGKGIYAIEEHFDKILLEFNRRQEGPILKYDDKFFHLNRMLNDRDLNSFFDSPYPHDIIPFKLDKIKRNPELSKQYKIARSLFNSWREGKIATSKVFDIKRLSEYFAILELTSSYHSVIWHNRRFYYNPTTTKFEPVAYDMRSSLETSFLLVDIDDTWPNGFLDIEEFFDDPQFTYAYVKALKKYSNPSFLDSTYKVLKDDFDYYTSYLSKEYPFFKFDKDVFYKNQKYINMVLNPPQIITAKYSGLKNDSLIFDIGNYTPFPVEILSISDGINNLPIIGTDNIIAGQGNRDPLHFEKKIFGIGGFKASQINITNFRINYKKFGHNDIFTGKIDVSNKFNPMFIEKDCLRNFTDLNGIKFLEVDELKKEITFNLSECFIKNDIVIPPGYKVIIPAGTKIFTMEESKIVSFSPVFFNGTPENRVIFKSIDSSGQGIAVIKANQKSKLQYVTFEKLSALSCQEWELRGANTFYESNVEIKNCIFKDNNSEDALNIVRSDFSIENSKFENIFGDAFDGDFCNGKLFGLTFANIGNDAIDVSNSNVFIKDVFIKFAGDKGLSAGENSFVEVDNITVRNSNTGVSSKDLSRVLIVNSSISDSEIGFSLYQKKPEFGPSFMSVNSSEFINLQSKYEVEKGSTLVFDNNLIFPTWSGRVFKK